LIYFSIHNSDNHVTLLGLQSIPNDMMMRRQRHKDTQLLPYNSSSSSIKPVTCALGYLNSPKIREQHASVLKKFFLLLELEGKDLDEQGLAFLNQVRRSKGGSQWASQSIKK
jgi:hypothetical protein